MWRRPPSTRVATYGNSTSPLRRAATPVERGGRRHVGVAGPRWWPREAAAGVRTASGWRATSSARGAARIVTSSARRSARTPSTQRPPTSLWPRATGRTSRPTSTAESANGTQGRSPRPAPRTGRRCPIQNRSPSNSGERVCRTRVGATATTDRSSPPPSRRVDSGRRLSVSGRSRSGGPSRATPIRRHSASFATATKPACSLAAGWCPRRRPCDCTAHGCDLPQCSLSDTIPARTAARRYPDHRR